MNGIGGQDLFTFVSVAKLQAFWYKIPLVFAVELYFLKKIIFFFKLIFFMLFRLFWYTDIKNNFFLNIYYFNIFSNKKQFK